MQAYVVISAISVVIQVATKSGLLAICLTLVAFACALASGTPRVRAARGVAALALLAGLVPAGFLLFADAWLAPPRLMALFCAQVVWHAGIAWTLFTHPDRSPAALPPHAYSPVDAQS